MSSTAAAQRSSTRSKAPLVYCRVPPSRRCRVDMSLRALSKGSSAMRGQHSAAACRSAPQAAAKAARAVSVGSPMRPSAPRATWEHRAPASASSRGGPTQAVTVMRFWVSVPVLSAQITCTAPKDSTADMERARAFLRLMAATPRDSTSVTTTTSPSGTAATAKDTASKKASRGR